MIPFEWTGKNVHQLLFTLCDAKYSENVEAFFMGNLDFDTWSDATDGDTNNSSLDSGVDGVRYSQVWVRKGKKVFFFNSFSNKNGGYLYNYCTSLV